MPAGLGIEFGDDRYRLVHGSQEGELADYGDYADITVGNDRYVALVEDDPEGTPGDVVSALGDEWIYKAIPNSQIHEEDVTFDVEGEEGDGEELEADIESDPDSDDEEDEDGDSNGEGEGEDDK